MKRIIFITFILFLTGSLFAQDKSNEYYFKFEISHKSEIDTITQLISIDNVKNLEVYAYALPDQFDDFKKLGYEIEYLQKDIPKSLTMAATVGEMSNFDKYPTYEVYRAMMKNFESNYPSLCKLDSIGETNNGRQLYVLKISDQVNTEEAEPEFFYTSTMHGDETTGFILLLRLADSLLSTYGNSAHITELVNEIEIYINPNANPDGTYYGGNHTVQDAIRSNGTKDLNRDFPDPRTGANSPYQSETQAMMDFAEEHNFVMSANFHGGVEVMNYPWDTWYYSENPHADTDWFEYVCTDYVTTARTVKSNYMTDLYSDGVTHGATWYKVAGGRQDYMNYWHQCREVTMEISTTKLLAVENLTNYWNYNKQSLLNYINECLYGIRGIVKNTSNIPLKAQIEIISHDDEGDSSMVFTDPDNGNYHRLIEKGTYDMVVSADGYVNDTTTNLVVNWKEITWKNITLRTPDELGDSIALSIEPSLIYDTLYFDQTNSHNLIIANDSNAVVTDYTIQVKNAATNYWISLNKSSGYLYDNLNDTVTLTINTIDLTTGVYSASLFITSADSEVDTVTVNLLVKDTISTSIEPKHIIDTLWGGDSTAHEIYLKNNGLLAFDYTLQIVNPEINNWISLDKSTGSLEITESDTVNATIVTSGLGFGSFNCSVVVEKENSTNDTITFSILVKDTLSASITPLTITDTIEQHSDKSYILIIQNTGNSLLEYNVNIDFPTKSDTWISVNKYSGLIATESSDTLILAIDSSQMVSGDYTCQIIFNENDGDILAIPIDIHVNQTLSISESLLTILRVYPNPFHDELVIEFNPLTNSPILLSLFSINGNMVFQKKLRFIGDKNILILNSDDLNNIPKGIYLLQFSSANYTVSKKLIKH